MPLTCYVIVAGVLAETTFSAVLTVETLYIVKKFKTIRKYGHQVSEVYIKKST